MEKKITEKEKRIEEKMKKYENSVFDYLQLREIKYGLLEGVDVSVYTDARFSAAQMEQIRLGLLQGLDVWDYVTPIFNHLQMREIRKGLRAGIDVSQYLDSALRWELMKLWRRYLTLKKEAQMNKKITEKEIENYLVCKVRNFAGRSYKFTSPTAAGVPDRIVLLNNCVFFVEVKCPGGKLTHRQAERLMELKGMLSCNCAYVPRCAVLSTKEEVNAWVLYACGTVLPEFHALLGEHKYAGCLCSERIARQIDSLLNLNKGDTYERL